MRSHAASPTPKPCCFPSIPGTDPITPTAESQAVGQPEGGQETQGYREEPQELGECNREGGEEISV